MANLIKRLFGMHVHDFGPWRDEPEPREVKLVSRMMGTTYHPAWYQRRICLDPVCGFAEISNLDEYGKKGAA